MGGILDYAPGATVVHRLNPIVKIVFAFCTCVAAFLTESLPALCALLALDVAVGCAGGIPQRTLRLLSGLVKVSVFLFVLQVLFIRSGTPVFFFVTDVGVHTACLVVLRLIVATMPLALMLALTPMSDLSNALVKVARLPYRYAFAFTTALRFIPVFTGEMRQIMEAQTARGVEFDTGNPLRKVGLVLPLCMPMLVSSVGRVQQSALAAETRGFYLRDRASGYRDYPFGALDAGALALTVVVVAFGVVL